VAIQPGGPRADGVNDERLGACDRQRRSGESYGEPKTTLAMHTLLLCSDVPFLRTNRCVLSQFQVTPKVVGSCDEALRLIEEHEFDLIVVDWREVMNLGEFLGSVRRSKLNQECVLVAIVRDLPDLRQAFAAGVKFLIHKPPSTIQIERCLRAAYSATVARRRRHHRESVNFAAFVGARNRPCSEVTVVNLSGPASGSSCSVLMAARALF
jgi:CheY-like chemotaxis protein